MKKLLLLSILSLSSFVTYASDAGESLSYKARLPFYKSGWHLLEDALITKPHNVATGNFWTIDLLVGGVSGVTTYTGISLIAKERSGFAQKKNLLSLLSIPLGAYLSQTIQYPFLFSMSARSELKKLLDEWNDISGFLPQESVAGLNALKDIYKKPSSKGILDEAVRLLTIQIRERFPDRYKNEKPFSLKNLDVKNTLAVSKFILDLASAKKD